MAGNLQASALPCLALHAAKLGDGLSWTVRYRKPAILPCFGQSNRFGWTLIRTAFRMCCYHNHSRQLTSIPNLKIELWSFRGFIAVIYFADFLVQQRCDCDNRI